MSDNDPLTTTVRASDKAIKRVGDLKRGNWKQWSQALMAMAMVAQCWDAIEGEDEPAKAAETDSEGVKDKKRTARSKWMARRSKANELIHDYAGEEARGDLGELDALADPKASWAKLTKAYEGRLTDVQLAKMATPFYTMRLEEGGDIAKFLTAFQAKRNELNAASQVKNKADLIPEHAVFGLLLTALPIGLRDFVSLAGDVTYSQVLIKLRNFHDDHGAGVTTPASASAFYAQPPPLSTPVLAAPAKAASTTSSNRRTPKIRASDYANASNWPHGIKNDRFVVKYGQCWTCLDDGHISTGCTTIDPSLHRASVLAKYGINIPATRIAAFLYQQPPVAAAALAVLPSTRSTPPPTPSSTFPAHVGTFFVTLNSTNLALSAITPGDEFLFDTGATCSITPHRHLLHDYQPLEDTIPVIDAGGKETRAVGMGTLRPVCTLPDGSTMTFSISGVLHIPGFVVNLISGIALFTKGVTMTNTTSTISLFNPEGKLMATGNFGDRIVLEARWSSLPRPALEHALIASSPPTSSDAITWHRRLGHLHLEGVKRMAKGGVVRGMVLKPGGEQVEACRGCLQGKATRSDIPRGQNERAKGALDVVHADCWGPTVHKTAGGETMMLGMMCDATRYRWGVGIRSKTEVVGKVENFVAMVERASERKVKTFHTDNGSEFFKLDAYFKKNGISHSTTVPYAHHQNPIERGWRSMFDTVRSWLLESGLPPSFWIHAANAYLFVHNRRPTRSLPGGITPFEAFFGRAPDIHRLRVWGCVAWVWIPREKQGAKDSSARAIRCTFIGYSDQGYLFWDPERRRIVESADAKFFEEEFAKLRSAEEESSMQAWGREQEAGTNVEEEAEEGLVEHEAVVLGEEETEGEDEISDAQAGNEEQGGGAEEEGAAAQVPEGYAPRIAESEGSDVLAEKWGAKEGGRGARRTRSSVSYRGLAALPAPNKQLVDISPFLDEFGDRFPPTLVDLGDCTKGWTDIPHLSAYQVWTGSPDEPTYKQAMAGPDREDWSAAEASEMATLRAMGTWDEEESEAPAGRKAIPTKLVLVRKRNERGDVIKYKARLVARGDLQRPGDFGETFSPTARITSIRLVNVIGHMEGWNRRQFDVNSAYLHGNIDEPLWIRLPDGTTHRLRRSIYGLKQSGREWNNVLHADLVARGFVRIEEDRGIYRRVRIVDGKELVLIIAIYVDDGVATGNDDVDEFLRDFSSRFTIRTGAVDLFLGMKISVDEQLGTISFDQQHQIEAVLKEHGMESCSTAPTPTSDTSGSGKDSEWRTNYRQLVGELLWIAQCTRPDISFAVSQLARWCNDPQAEHFGAAKRVLRYLRGTAELGLTFSRAGGVVVDVLCDADHATDKAGRRSVSAFVVRMGGGAISWSSKRQLSVSLSSTQAETVSLSEAARETLWVRSLLIALGFPPPGATTIHVDSTGAIALASHPTSHSTAKHIDTRHHFTRELIVRGIVVLRWVPTHQMVADGLTKGLVGAMQRDFVKDVGLKDVLRKGACWKGLVEQSSEQSVNVAWRAGGSFGGWLGI